MTDASKTSLKFILSSVKLLKVAIAKLKSTETAIKFGLTQNVHMWKIQVCNYIKPLKVRTVASQKSFMANNLFNSFKWVFLCHYN
ncbi:MAG: hypothetical protein RMZ69_09785 [Nostoc sp. ChiQUE01a]|nr:hypothetical protein [Nostoc sp. ChiQUE01a]